MLNDPRSVRWGSRPPLLAVSVLAWIPLGAQDMPAPTDIQCLSFSPTYNVIYFWSAAEDATEYVLEHSVNGNDDFHEHARVSVTAFGDRQPHFDDQNLDPLEHYYYRVRSFRARDGAFSPYSAEVRSPHRFQLPGTPFMIYFNLVNEAPRMSVERGNHPNHVDGRSEDPLDVIRRLGGVLDAVRAEYLDVGFRRPWQADPSQPMPVNVKWICNGGQFPTNGIDGMAIAPEFLGGYDPASNEGDARLLGIPFHELFHGVTQAYGGKALSESWVVEGPTDAMADLSCVVQDGACLDLDDEFYSHYYGLVHDYLGDPGRSLTELLYPASLFWAYLCDQYGTERSEPRIGRDFIRSFLEEAEENPGLDAIEVVETTLAKLGHAPSFPHVFTEFAIANYLKGLGGPNVPARYKYSDNVPSLAYPPVSIDHAIDLDLQSSSGVQLSGVRRWAARYIEVLPPNGSVMVQLQLDVETPDPVTVVRVVTKDDDLISEEQATGRELDRSFVLNDGEKMALIVVGLDRPANFRFVISKDASPVLSFVEPTEQKPVCIGCGSRTPFLVRMQALDVSSLTPIHGLDTRAFSFDFFSSSSMPGTVYSAFQIGEEYRFLVQPPDLRGIAPGSTVTLIVRHPYFRQPAVADRCLVYCPDDGCSSDTVLVLDRSSSMGCPSSKLLSAQEAAKLYIDSFETGDRVGIVSFNASATDDRFNLDLQNWTGASRLAALQVIGTIPAAGGTSTGAGLLEALDELDARGRSRVPWSLVLMSDGINTVDPDIPFYLEVHAARVHDEKQVPEVHTVGIGSDANRPDLEDIASRTGGSFHFLTQPPCEGAGAQAGPGSLDFHRTISEVFRVVSEKVAGHQQVYSATGRAVFGQPPVIHTIMADSRSSELVVAVVGDSRMNIVLQEVETKRSYEPFARTQFHTVFRVEPLDGIVHALSLSLGSVCEGCPTQVDYLVEASVLSTITMNLLLPLPAPERVAGTPMPILVALHGQGSLSRPRVTAAIVRQDMDVRVAELQLLDDGRHGDGAAGDGLFGNTFRATHVPTDYRVEATATETVSRLDPFERRRIESFHIRADADPDGDGMPSAWEIRMGLDPARNDAALDPDGDGWHNVSELQLGTDPLDADTDDDGESDQEPWFGRDPNVSGDGVISPARIRARAGVGFVFLAFNMPRGAVSFDVLRARGRDAPFEVLLDDWVPPADLSFLDKALTNGIPYRYRFISNGPNGERSGPSNTAEATPALDPYPPHGRVEIVTGPRTPRFGEVTLRLAASDNPGEDHVLPLIGFDPTSRSSGVAEMIIANTSSFAKGPPVSPVYEPFDSTKAWVLEPDESGFAIVFVRFRDVAGNVSEIASDAVQLGSGPSPDGFRRADANADARHDISDAIFTLGFLFLGSPTALGCEKSADSNDDGTVNISDPVHLLGHLFSGGPAPPAPYPDCGEDPTLDSLGCSSYPTCE